MSQPPRTRVRYPLSPVLLSSQTTPSPFPIHPFLRSLPPSFYHQPSPSAPPPIRSSNPPYSPSGTNIFVSFTNLEFSLINLVNLPFRSSPTICPRKCASSSPILIPCDGICARISSAVGKGGEGGRESVAPAAAAAAAAVAEEPAGGGAVEDDVVVLLLVEEGALGLGLEKEL